MTFKKNQKKQVDNGLMRTNHASENENSTAMKVYWRERVQE